MKRFLVALLALAALASAPRAFADPVTTPSSQNVSGTVTVGGTFQQIIPSAAGTRKGCIVQNPTTATEILSVFFGPTASATTGKSVTLVAGAMVSCTTGTGQVPDAVNVTATTAGHSFMAAFQ